MILTFVDIKNPILRNKAKPVGNIDKKVERLIEDMWETLISQKDPEGVGLAAPQIGKSLQIFLVYHEDTKMCIIDPKVVSIKKSKEKKRKKKEILEGCLSLPHFYGPIERNKEITIEYTDLNNTRKTEKFTGFFAQIIEHEIDHLNGVLFIDRILEQKAPLYKFSGDDWEEVELI